MILRATRRGKVIFDGFSWSEGCRASLFAAYYGLKTDGSKKAAQRKNADKNKNAEARREGSSFRLFFAVDKEEREERGGLQRDSFHCPG